MKRPSSLARLCGSPVMAMMLFVACGAVVIGCYQHRFPGLFALLAVLAAWRTLKAMGSVRRYKAWAAKWQAVVAEEMPRQAHEVQPSQAKPLRPKKPRGRVWRFVLGAALLVLAFPFSLKSPEAFVPQQPHTPEECAAKILWCALCCVYLWRLSRRGARKSMAVAAGVISDAQRQASHGPDVVTCLVPLPSFSPSRADAMRDLPDYCARLIAPGNGATVPLNGGAGRL